tara:strand:+ start:401 stop:622 length:222 start_codon:yes stop_codon:yes gene_type:complete
VLIFPITAVNKEFRITIAYIKKAISFVPLEPATNLEQIIIILAKFPKTKVGILKSVVFNSIAWPLLELFIGFK